MIYHVFANKSNIGDWLSAKGIQTMLTDGSFVELLCDEPFVDETIGRLRSLQPDDLVIIGGGGLFMDYFADFWDKFSQLKQVNFSIWGVGYCDTTNEPSRPPQQLIEAVVQRSRCCFVRDELTHRYLSRFELPSPGGCPSVLYLQEDVHDGRGLLHIDNYTTVGARAFDEMDEMGRQFAADTQRRFRHFNNKIPAGNESRLQSSLQYYRDADIVLSSALHGCIIGVSLGCKVVAVSGDRKIDSFMKGVGLEDWVCGNDELNRLPDLLRRVGNQTSPAESLKKMRKANEFAGQQILSNARNLTG
jgi:polysaccharide pyruvyl transferase WcaK-like protein